MEFLTIHELSRQFDTPARVIRYRFHKLRQAGKLAEVQDYRRDDLVDDQHFEWKINPVSFMHAAGMTLAATGPASALGNSPATKSEPLVAKVDNQPPPPVTETPRPVNQAAESVAKPVTVTTAGRASATAASASALPLVSVRSGVSTRANEANGIGQPKRSAARPARSPACNDRKYSHGFALPRQYAEDCHEV